MKYSTTIRNMLKLPSKQLNGSGSIIEQTFPGIKNQSPLTNGQDKHSYN